MDFIPALLILYLAARLAGEAMQQIGQSPMIGEVLAGILLGPSMLRLIDPNPLVNPGMSLSVVSNLGILVLVLLAGMELGREGLRRAVKERSIIVAFVEFFLPFVLGFSLASWMSLGLAQSLFLGTAMAVTALPISVRILLDLNLLHTRLGRAIVTVALANDLVAFAMLGLVLDVARLGGAALDPPTIGLILAKNLLFLGLVYALALLLKWAMRATPGGMSRFQTFLERLKGQETGMAVSILIALSLGAAAEAAGIHFAVGVFYGGVLITPRLLGDARFVRIRSALQTVTFGLLAPIFFGFVGLNFSFDLRFLPMVAVVTAVAFSGKFVGGILGGLFAGFRGRPLIALGVGLNARGMMELLLAQVGLATGIIGPDLYSALIVMSLLTTLSTPPLLKRIMRGFKAHDFIPEPVPAKEPGG